MGILGTAACSIGACGQRGVHKYNECRYLPAAYPKEHGGYHAQAVTCWSSGLRKNGNLNSAASCVVHFVSLCTAAAPAGAAQSGRLATHRSMLQAQQRSAKRTSQEQMPQPQRGPRMTAPSHVAQRARQRPEPDEYHVDTPERQQVLCPVLPHPLPRPVPMLPWSTAKAGRGALHMLGPTIFRGQVAASMRWRRHWRSHLRP